MMLRQVAARVTRFGTSFVRILSLRRSIILSDGPHVVFRVTLLLFSSSFFDPAGARTFATTFLSKLNERHAWIASALKAAGSRDEFDKSAAANKINFAAIVEEDITCTRLLLRV
jgi:hypothetical protein